MEDIRKLLQSSGGDDISLDSDDSAGCDSDVSYDSVQIKVGHTTSDHKRKRNGEARLPTRRPDPNIYNRNALLARENRRKKKVHLETIEKELEEARNTNRTLLKHLKKQMKAARRLEQEKQYFKSLVSNRTEILSLVSALNTRLSAQPLSPPSSLNHDYSGISPGSSSSLGGDDGCGYYDGGGSSIHRDGYRRSSSSSYDPEPLAIHFDQQQRHSPSTNDYAPTSAFDDTWHELLQEGEFVDLNQPQSSTDNAALHINDDHNYDMPMQKAADNVGVCLHIARGKVSLEFCPRCNCNAASTSRTPPTQLFQED